MSIIYITLLWAFPFNVGCFLDLIKSFAEQNEFRRRAAERNWYVDGQ